MSSTIPLGLLLTDDRIWQNSASTRGFKARLVLVVHIGSNVVFIAVQVDGLNFWNFSGTGWFDTIPRVL